MRAGIRGSGQRQMRWSLAASCHSPNSGNSLIKGNLSWGGISTWAQLSFGSKPSCRSPVAPAEITSWKTRISRAVPCSVSAGSQDNAGSGSALLVSIPWACPALDPLPCRAADRLPLVPSIIHLQQGGWKFHEELLENAGMPGNGREGLRFRDAAQALVCNQAC